MKLKELLGPRNTGPSQHAPGERYIPTLIKEFARSESSDDHAPPRFSSWHHDDDANKLICDFDFASPKLLARFVQEVLVFQEDSHHHGVITIEPELVHVEVWTHRLNDVTDLDHEYANELMNIYNDIIEVFNVE
jgi:pterin-4a-carbinolamine dehydratase